MSSLLVIILFAIVLVALFVLAISITLIVKGRNIDSEIGTNKNMKHLGIKCTAQQMRDEERLLKGETGYDPSSDCNVVGCATCGVEEASSKGC